MAYAPTAPPPHQPPQQGGRRGLLWVAIGCGVLVVLFLLIAVIGGVVFLLVRSGEKDHPTESTPATQTFTADSFTAQYPAEWSEVPQDGHEGDSGEVLEVESADKKTHLAIYRYQPNGQPSAATECAAQSHFLSMYFEGEDSPQEEETRTVDGRDGYHYSQSGTADGFGDYPEGEGLREDMWCMADGENIVQVTATTHGSTDLGPEADQILDSWSWTSQD